MSEMMQMKARK